MTGYILRTEVYKIFSKKSIWIVCTLFSIIFILFKLQFANSFDVLYNMEPAYRPIQGSIEGETKTVVEAATKFSNDVEAFKGFLPKETRDYIESFNGQKFNNHDATHFAYTLIRIDLSNVNSRYKNRQEYIDKIKQKLSELENKEDTTSFEYRSRLKQVKMYEGNQNPGLYYNVRRWSDIVDFNYTFGPLLIALMVIFGLAGIYSDEYAQEIDSILLTTSNGRGRLAVTKIVASVIYTLFCWAWFNLLGFFTNTAIIGMPTGDVPLVNLVKFLYTPFDWTAGQYYRLQLLLSLIGALSVAAFTLFISSRTRGALISFVTASIVFGVPFLASKLFERTSILSDIISLTYEVGFYYTMSLENMVASFKIVNFLGQPVMLLFVNIAFIIIVLIVSGALSYRYFTCRKVKG